MKKALFFIVLLFLFSCSSDNSNIRVELSKSTSNLVEGVKVYAGYGFTIFEIEIDNVKYLANSQGGIIKK
jgi:hypothetical protein